MGSKTRLSSYCTKRANNGVNLATSRKIITRLARPIVCAECLAVFLRDRLLIESDIIKFAMFTPVLSLFKQGRTRNGVEIMPTSLLEYLTTMRYSL